MFWQLASLQHFYKKESVGPVHTQEGELNKSDPCVGEAPWVYGAVLGLGSIVTIG